MVADGVLQGGNPNLMAVVLQESLNVYIVHEVHLLQFPVFQIETVETGTLGSQPDISPGILAGKGRIDVAMLRSIIHFQVCNLPGSRRQKSQVHILHKKQNAAILQGSELGFGIIPGIVVSDSFCMVCSKRIFDNVWSLTTGIDIISLAGTTT